MFDEYLETGERLKARSQELRRLRHNTSFYCVRNSHNDPDADVVNALQGLIPDSIVLAVKTAREVAKREHVKADRIERVNIFITNLRREVHQASIHREAKRWLVNALCHKSLWQDIGIPDLPLFRQMRYVHKVGGGSTTIEEPLVRNWCQRAASMLVVAPEDEIQRDLDELKRSFGDFGVTIDMAVRINDEAEVVVDRFVQLGEEVKEF